MSPVGVIGLGEMGGPISSRLLERGYVVVGYDPDQGRSAVAAGSGVKLVESPRAVAAAAEHVVILIVGTVAHAVDACLGPDGCAGAMDGKVLVVMSTLDPETVEGLDAEVIARGGWVLDAPCGGGAPAIPSGELSVMAAGEPSAFELGEEVLDALASTVHRMGDRAGLGQVAKLLTQISLAINLTGVVEIIGLAESYGMDGRRALAAVSTSSGRSLVSSDFELFADSMRDHNVGVIHKDLRAIIGRAVQRDVSVTLGAAAMSALRSTWPFSWDR